MGGARLTRRSNLSIYVSTLWRHAVETATVSTASIPMSVLFLLLLLLLLMMMVVVPRPVPPPLAGCRGWPACQPARKDAIPRGEPGCGILSDDSRHQLGIFSDDSRHQLRVLSGDSRHQLRIPCPPPPLPPPRRRQIARTAGGGPPRPPPPRGASLAPARVMGPRAIARFRGASAQRPPPPSRLEIERFGGRTAPVRSGRASGSEVPPSSPSPNTAGGRRGPPAPDVPTACP